MARGVLREFGQDVRIAGFRKCRYLRQHGIAEFLVDAVGVACEAASAIGHERALGEPPQGFLERTPA